MELLSPYPPRVQCPENAKESISALLASLLCCQEGIQLCVRLLLSLHKADQLIFKNNRFRIKHKAANLLGIGCSELNSPGAVF